MGSRRPRTAQSLGRIKEPLSTVRTAPRAHLARQTPSERYIAGSPSVNRTEARIARTSNVVGVKHQMSSPEPLQEQLSKRKPNPQSRNTSAGEVAYENYPIKLEPFELPIGIQSQTDSAITAAGENPHEDVSSANSIAEQFLQSLQKMQTATPKNFPPLLSPATHDAFKPLLSHASVLQGNPERWRRAVYGIIFCMVVNLLRMLTSPGGRDPADGQFFACDGLNDFRQDLSLYNLDRALAAHNVASATSWGIQLEGRFPGHDLLEYITFVVAHYRLPIAIDHASLGLDMDQAVISGLLANLELMTPEDRILVAQYLTRLVQEFAKAKAARQDWPEDNKVAILAGDLLVMGLTVILLQHVPDWMQVLMTDHDLLYPALALALMNRFDKPICELTRGDVNFRVYTPGMEENPRPEDAWCEEVAKALNIAYQQAPGNHQ